MWWFVPRAPSADGIGGSDCELLRDAALAQPVNALTSGAYILVGLAVIAQARRHRRPMWSALVYGACLAAVGVGSVLFHGPQPPGSRVLHDLPILLAVLFIVVHDVALVRTRPTREPVVFGVAVAIAVGVTLVDLNAGMALTGMSVVSVAVLEIVIYRRGIRPVETRRQRQVGLAIIATSGVAGLTWLLGRTGSATCDPDAVFQFHGLWHVISAAVFGAWWWLAFDVGREWRLGPDVEETARASR